MNYIPEVAKILGVDLGKDKGSISVIQIIVLDVMITLKQFLIGGYDD